MVYANVAGRQHIPAYSNVLGKASLRENEVKQFVPA